MADYYKIVGAYVSEYAELERIMRDAIRAMSGIDEATYAILVGDPRSSELASKCRKLANLRLAGTIASHVEDCFTHLDHLTALRNRLVHYAGVAMGEEVAIFLKPEKPSERPYGKTTLNNLAAAQFDLTNLSEALRINLGPVEPPGLRPHAWIYIPPPQPQTGRSKRKGNPSSRPPPKP